MIPDHPYFTFTLPFRFQFSLKYWRMFPEMLRDREKCWVPPWFMSFLKVVLLSFYVHFVSQLSWPLLPAVTARRSFRTTTQSHDISVLIANVLRGLLPPPPRCSRVLLPPFVNYWFNWMAKSGGGLNSVLLSCWLTFVAFCWAVFNFLRSFC